MYILDPLELIDLNIERLVEKFVDEYTCMECGQRKDYELNTPDARPDSPLLCNECINQ